MFLKSLTKVIKLNFLFYCEHSTLIVIENSHKTNIYLLLKFDSWLFNCKKMTFPMRNIGELSPLVKLDRGDNQVSLPYALMVMIL